MDVSDEFKDSFYSIPLEFFMISPQHNNAHIANFVLAMPFKIEKTDKVCNLER